MKKVVYLVGLFFASTNISAQQRVISDVQVSHKISDKVADSLGLDEQTRAKLFRLSQYIAEQKLQARKASNDRAGVGKRLQLIENSRDSLYKTVLSPAKYQQYLQRKRTLIGITDQK